jgi:hypothetical protein
MTTPDPAKADLIRKIRALLAKSKSTDSEHEALAFASKARALALCHGLDATALDPEAIGFEDGVQPYGTRWSKQIAMATAEMFGCSVYRSTGRRGHLVFVGREGDRLTTDLMAAYFVKSVQRLARRNAATGQPTQSFALACGLTLAARIRKAAQRDRYAVDQAKRADEHMRTKMRLRAGKRRQSFTANRDAVEAGCAAASGVGLHRKQPSRDHLRSRHANKMPSRY